MSNLCPLDYRYGREDMKAIFYEESRLQFQMDVEAALARAHASLGTITEEQAAEITRVASLDVVDINRVKEIEKDTRHDLMAMVKAMTEKCEGDAGKFVHYGATSNDIVDTAVALQIKAAIEIIQADVDRFTLTLAKLAKRERVEQAKPRACAGKMAGAVGTGAALGKNFFKIQKTVMDDLGLAYEPAATQVVGRDRYTEIITLMANIATSLERYGTEIRNLQRSEIGEAQEPFDVKKQVGSSTMAQKRNPMMSENVCGLARVVRSMVTPTFESQVLWHERDLSNSSTERFVLPHVFVLLDEMFHKMNEVFDGLTVNKKNMLRNIESSRGLVMAEAIMMKMTEKGIGRQDAHEIVRSASMIAEDEERQLVDVLIENKDLLARMPEAEIRSAMDPANYTGGAKEIVDMMVAEVESVLGQKV